MEAHGWCHFATSESGDPQQYPDRYPLYLILTVTQSVGLRKSGFPRSFSPGRAGEKQRKGKNGKRKRSREQRRTNGVRRGKKGVRGQRG